MADSVPCKGEFTQPVKFRPKEVSVRLGSYPGDARVTEASKPRGQRPVVSGGSANVRAATQVKPAQASKVVMRAPSLLSLDEGRRGQPDNRHATVVLLAGVWGAARTHTRELATRETCGNRSRATPLREASSAGVGGAHTTDEAGERRWRKGALVRGAFERAESRGLA